MTEARDGVLVLVEEDSHLAAGGTPVVTQVLGRVLVQGAVVNGDPAANSTRWIIDVEVLPGVDVVIRLLDYRSGRRILPDLMSFSIAPLDADCCDAKPFAVPGLGQLTIRTRKLPLAHLVVHCRVAIDVMHSATR